MTYINVRRFLAVGTFLGAVAVLGNGCSSSTSSTPGTADGATPGTGSDAMTPIHRGDAAPPPGTVDAAGGGADGSTTPAPDMTSGKTCKADADCSMTGGNVCSTNLTFTYTKVSGSFWPTPICMVAPVSTGGNCDPGVSGLHFCDGPDDPTSPGICLPLSNPPVAGNGICLPKCTFALDGTAATGCPGKDTCTPYDFVLSGGVVSGYGYCEGTCQTDADCSALGTGWGCQVDIGACTKLKVARTKPIGTPCSSVPTTGDSATGACHCAGGTGMAGYCTQACVIGGTPCPTGYACDLGIPKTFAFGGDAGSVAGPAVQNVGLTGLCLQTCTLGDGGTPTSPSEAGAGADGGAAEAGDAGTSGTADASPHPATGCPMNSACSADTVAGALCQPL